MQIRSNNSVKTEDQTARISIMQSPVPRMQYVSGLTVYTEQFDGGKLIGKKWAAEGRLDNDVSGLDQKVTKSFGVDVPCQAFSLNMDGQKLDWGWTLDSAESEEQQNRSSATLVLSHTVRPVKVKVCTEVDGTSFFSRWLEITNTANCCL